jgi:hypothetical protein
MQWDCLLLLIITIIHYMQEHKNTCSQIIYQITTNECIIFRIFNKTIITTCFILSLCPQNIDKNDRKLKTQK